MSSGEVVRGYTTRPNKIAESDVSGPNFNLRLPLAVQPSRSLRVGLLYWF